MKICTLDTLVCPVCKGFLNLQVFDLAHGLRNPKIEAKLCSYWCARYGLMQPSSENLPDSCLACRTEEVMDGTLRCACGAWFPIIQGVPRLLPPELRHTLIDYYPSFFRYYEKSLPLLEKKEREDLTSALEIKGKENTIYRFSYEWNEFEHYDDDNFATGIGPIPEDFFKGKRILDAGCGAGRHAREALHLGAKEVFAMDLSNAVDAAFKNTITAGNIHVVQGDMFHLPFRPQSLDLIYSLYALPHTHNPPLTFQSMVPFLNSSGTIIVYLYNSQRWLSYKCLALMRGITTRLPNPWVRGLAFIIGAVDYYFLILPYRMTGGWKALHKRLTRFTPTHIMLYATRTFKTCYTDWMDRLFYPYVHYYSREDVDHWLAQARLA
ncbi:MAG: methyltransferase domain-containing protein, partial [Deltaproteobacteria bacterium]|nr:methyltransferase domain-containing protein [Deltaproteobacteria bacterium]